MPITQNSISDLLGRISDENMYMIFGAMVSADTLSSKDECESALDIADKLIAAIPDAGLSEMKRSKWTEMAEKAKKIISADLKKFEK